MHIFCMVSSSLMFLKIKICKKEFIQILFITFIWNFLMHNSFQGLVNSACHFWKACLFFLSSDFRVFGHHFTHINTNLCSLQLQGINLRDFGRFSYRGNGEKEIPSGSNSKVWLSSLSLLLLCPQSITAQSRKPKKIFSSGRKPKKIFLTKSNKKAQIF